VLLALVALLAPRPVLADQCHIDRDCGEGKTCMSGACIDPSKRQAMAAADAADDAVVSTRGYFALGVTGACVFGAAWIGTMVAAGATAEDGHKRGAVGHAAVPVVGPVLMSSEGTAPADIEGVLIGLMALQGAGLVTAFVGLTADSLVLEPRADGEAALLSVSPVVGPTGVGVVGRF